MIVFVLLSHSLLKVLHSYSSRLGKSFHLYHMDADIGAATLDLSCTKDNFVHASFSEDLCGVMTERLVKAGYKVARVEQTETTDMLNARKQGLCLGAPMPQVLNREVCSIVTRGTRTRCYNDDDNDVGPLLAIREVLLPPSRNPSDENDIQPVCKYGITIVDTMQKTVTIGEFDDDMARSQISTVLETFEPSEVRFTCSTPTVNTCFGEILTILFCPFQILIEGGKNGVSPELKSLLRSAQATSRQGMAIEKVHITEMFPKSGALYSDARTGTEGKSLTMQPWDPREMLDGMKHQSYFDSSHWPKALQAAVERNADLALSSFGAALFYLQRNMLDRAILGSGIVEVYTPLLSSSGMVEASSMQGMGGVVPQREQDEDGLEISQTTDDSYTQDVADGLMLREQEKAIDHMALDGTALQNLEILRNSKTHTPSGSLISKIDFTNSPHGCRLLRAWLLRPLFQKEAIERRGDAVEELVSGAGAMARGEAQKVLSTSGDIEMLSIRICMEELPNQRTMHWNGRIYTKDDVSDLYKVLMSLQAVSAIPEKFASISIQSPLLRGIVRLKRNGGLFPDLQSALDWFFGKFDMENAKNGVFIPAPEVSSRFDSANEEIESIVEKLKEHEEFWCARFRAKLGHSVRWKYINMDVNSKDKFLIELPASIDVPPAVFKVEGER